MTKPQNVVIEKSTQEYKIEATYDDHFIRGHGNSLVEAIADLLDSRDCDLEFEAMGV